MRRTISIITLALIMAIGFASETSAQQISSMVATVAKTEHKAAVKKTPTAKQGKFYFKSADKMCLSVDNEKLIMAGTVYTIVKGGRKSVAKGEMVEIFRPLQSVLKSVITKSNINSLSSISGVSVTKLGNVTSITITPNVKAKRPLFSSFVVTLNTKTSELQSIRMNSKGGNYTEYVLSACSYNGSVDDALFK